MSTCIILSHCFTECCIGHLLFHVRIKQLESEALIIDLRVP